MKCSLLIIISFLMISCASNSDDRAKSLLHYELKQTGEFFLTSSLREISGLAFHNGKLYAHNDEFGIVFILDPESGKIIKQFFLGVRPVKKDFEGIAADGQYIYMITSEGVIYKFKEPDSAYTKYEEIKTPLTVKYDVEGLCYDDSTNSLLLVCKEYPKKKERNVRAVFAFDIESGKMINKPRFIISVDEIKERFGLKNFSPSAIEKHPDGNFYILSSDEKSIIVLSSRGEILEAARLPSKHMQPEGITFLQNGNMIISDEGGKDDAELTIYSYNPGNK